MAEFSSNLWAPWRMEYIRSLGEELEEDGCFLCRYWDETDHDRENRVVWRAESSFVVMNRFPYTNGHLLVSPVRHKPELTDLTVEELTEMTCAIRDGVGILRKTVNPHGFNIGYNVGICAGAGLPGHLHAHIVPRWTGDTNFMTVVGDARVVPIALDKLYDELAKRAVEANLRT